MDEQTRATIDKLKKEIKRTIVKVSVELRTGEDNEALAFQEGAKLAQRISKKCSSEVFLRAMGEIAIETAEEIESERPAPIAASFLGAVLASIDDQARAGYGKFKPLRDRIRIACSKPRAAAKLLWALDTMIVHDFGTFEDVPTDIDVRRWVKTHRPQELAALPGIGPATVTLWTAIRREYLEGIQ